MLWRMNYKPAAGYSIFNIFASMTGLESERPYFLKAALYTAYGAIILKES
jgi:hypothetical protein